jgi:hypothetical protein
VSCGFLTAVCGILTLLSMPAFLPGGPHPKGPSMIFEFHSGFWVNLDLNLYEQALSGPSDSRCSKVEGETASEWTASVLFYKQTMVSRDLLFDPRLVAIKNSLEDQEHAGLLSPTAALPSPLVAVLERVAPIYRSTCWNQQDQANKDWIRQALPLVGRYGAELEHELSAAYQVPWPTGPVRVDVTNYASWAGAYTTNQPTRITISSTDHRNQGTAALEILFHEASHGISWHLQRAILEECKKQGVLLPRRDLWHAVIFYTTGELVRRRIAGYVPYAYKNGLWNHAWPMYIGPLERDWKPYLDGQSPFDVAVRTLVKDAGERKN